MEKAANTINIIPFSATPAESRPTSSTHRHGCSGKTRLWNSSAMLQSVWESSTEGMRITDEKGLIVAVNEAYSQLVGMTSEKLVGNHFTCVYADLEDREKMTRDYETAFADRLIKKYEERTYVLWSEQVLEVQVSNTVIEMEDGRLFVLSRYRDITIERLTQRALADSESKYRGLFANSVLPMFQSSSEGKLLNANRALLRLFGYTNFYELADVDIARDSYVDPEDRKTVLATLHQKGYVVNQELRLKRKDGSIITVLENSRTLIDEDGKVIGYEGILEDITARKSMEKKLREYVWALEKSKSTLADLNAQKDKLFSILSHDLRSPFSSILGFCDILLKENDQLAPEERSQFVSYIQEAAQDQLALVNKLLDWSRLESGRIQMERVNVNLPDLVNRNVRTFAGLARQKQVDLISKLPERIVVRGDIQMLNQVFSNLFGNSLKFTPAGGTVSVELIEELENEWVIGVMDTGIGIPEEDVHKLFKVEEKYTRKGLQGEKGTGLGLPVVHEIIQKHRGSIEVQSSVGVGTLFLITLPKNQTTADYNILIVDDEQGMRMLHSRFIKRLVPQASILYASDGREAFQLAHEYQPKVIISDNDMPDSDGDELVRALKSDPTTRDIPIIIVTGHDSDANREALRKLGAAAILSKPVAPERLAETLMKIGTVEITIAA
jgi:PAS domain S-box-containing protein